MQKSIFIVGFLVALFILSGYPLDAMSIIRNNYKLKNGAQFYQNSNSEKVLLFEDFNDTDLPNLRVLNRFTDFSIYNGVGEMWVHGESRKIYCNCNIDNDPQYKYVNMSVRARLFDYYKGSDNKKLNC